MYIIYRLIYINSLYTFSIIMREMTELSFKEFDFRIDFPSGVEDTVVVYMNGGIFVSNLNDFREMMDSQRKSDAMHLVMDCNALDFLGSSAIGYLVNANESYKKLGKRIWLTSVSDEIMDVFSTLSIASFFLICDDTDKALEVIRNNS